MNNENKPSVISELTAALASMAERAAAAEAEAEQYKKSSGEWYQFYTSKDKELRDTQAELQKAFPDYKIEKDPLPLSIACHTGADALGVGIMKDIIR